MGCAASGPVFMPVALPTRTSDFRSFGDDNVLLCVRHLHSIVVNAYDQSNAPPEHRLAEPYTLYRAGEPGVAEHSVTDVAWEVKHVYTEMVHARRLAKSAQDAPVEVRLPDDTALLRREHALCCMHLETLKAAQLNFEAAINEAALRKAVVAPLPRKRLEQVVALFRRLNCSNDGVLSRADMEEAVTELTRTENLVDSIFFPFILYLVPTSTPGRPTCMEFIVLLHKFCCMSVEEITDFVFDGMAGDVGSLVDDAVLDMQNLKVKYPRLASAGKDHQPSNKAFLKELNKLHQEHLRTNHKLDGSGHMSRRGITEGPLEDVWVKQLTRREFRAICSRSPLILHPLMFIRTWFQSQTGGVRWWVSRAALVRQHARRSQKNLQFLSTNGKAVYIQPPGERKSGAKKKQQKTPAKRGAKAPAGKPSKLEAAPPMLRHGSSGYLVMRRHSDSSVWPARQRRERKGGRAGDSGVRRRSESTRAAKTVMASIRRGRAGSQSSVSSAASAHSSTARRNPPGAASLQKRNGSRGSLGSLRSAGSRRSRSRNGSMSSVDSGDSLGSLNSGASGRSRRAHTTSLPPVLATIQSERNLNGEGGRGAAKRGRRRTRRTGDGKHRGRAADARKDAGAEKHKQRLAVAGGASSHNASRASSGDGRRRSSGSSNADDTPSTDKHAQFPPRSPEPSMPRRWSRASKGSRASRKSINSLMMAEVEYGSAADEDDAERGSAAAVGAKRRSRAGSGASKRSFSSVRELTASMASLSSADEDEGGGGLRRRTTGGAAFTSTINFKHNE